MFNKNASHQETAGGEKEKGSQETDDENYQTSAQVETVVVNSGESQISCDVPARTEIWGSVWLDRGHLACRTPKTVLGHFLVLPQSTGQLTTIALNGGRSQKRVGGKRGGAT